MRCLNVKPILFQAIQFSISTQFVSIWPIDRTQVLPLRDRVNLGVISMKGCSVFPKASALQESHHQIVYCLIRTLAVGVLPLCSRCILQSQPTGQVCHRMSACVYICVWMYVCVCVYACVCACVRACVRACYIWPYILLVLVCFFTQIAYRADKRVLGFFFW